MTTVPAAEPAEVSSDILGDPRVADAAARQLLPAVRPLAPEAVLVWYEPDSAVLGHALARELGCLCLAATQTEGLVDLVTAPPRGTRVLLLSPRFTAPYSVRALLGVAGFHGLTVVAVAAVRDSPVLAEVDPGIPTLLPDPAGHAA
jgi:hypothetical protein